ncbi:hypothetical protein COCVIDRAFT_84234 [Bipolaris victoriae FI3]|uniref:Uncharacterized protein n=1 Tax=Bipolaris victoriae (strain FI3) TaxID=930091 RepID=W7ER04_BIPV3|nr:hypothetical protein COCVIDRAFT_84234 [Bipolaris victoriae FI3]
MGITNASSAVKGIFSLHVITACVSFLLFLAGLALFAKQMTRGRGQPRTMKVWQSTGKRHSATSTHLFVLTGLFCLSLAYAAQSATVALQSRPSTSPSYITSAYAYPHYPGTPTTVPDTRYTRAISILSFLYQLATILLNASIIGAIWIYANHVHSNASQLREPGFASMLLNGFWLLAILALGLASWSLGLWRRGSGKAALPYPTLIGADYVVRTLYVTYVSVVIAASTSVTLEAILCWVGIRKHGVPGNKFQSPLTRVVMLVTPLVWFRNAFSIAQLIILYRDSRRWSRRTMEALAFLFIIFGQLCDLAILALLLLGAKSFGRKDEVQYVGKEVRYSESVAGNRDSVMADRHYISNNVNGTPTGEGRSTFVDSNGVERREPAYVPHVSV